MAQPGNRAWSTVIQAINSQGWAIPPFIILAAQNHLANWYTETNLPTDWVIATTDNSWANNVHSRRVRRPVSSAGLMGGTGARVVC